MSEVKVRIVAGDEARKNGHMDMICSVDHYDMIYGKIERMTGNHSAAEDVASWCELASPGEIYEFSGGRAEIESK